VYPIREGKEEYMYLLAWIFIGVLVGWGSGRILVGNNSYGLFMDVAMGIAGAVAAGYLMRSAGFRSYGGTIATTAVVVIGAALLTILVGLVNGRKIYAG
jgi:uncharacterized membrane protein YeaQ/YmgE (transglycosylase-associated protein family)